MVQIIRRDPDKKKPGLERWIVTEPIEPVEYPFKPIEQRIFTWDTETDPFEYGVSPKPFCCGLYETDTGSYYDFWGLDCIDQFFAHCAKEYEGQDILILCHNFGNFDAYFILDYLDNNQQPFIINSRLVRVFAQGMEFRDSYAMVPVALSAYKKDDMDYEKMHHSIRDNHKEEILKYLKNDCVYLADLVTGWYETFGNKLTMASAALPMLHSFHGFERVAKNIDAELRQYYYGGRNQCFDTGIHHGEFKVYDINSSYPNVMRKYEHPISDTPYYEAKISEKTCFAHIRAWSLGALPVRGKGGALHFPIGTYDFYACIHEINAGIETGTLKILKVYSSIYFKEKTTFSNFVDHFYSERMKAAERGDEVNKLFYKLVLNSSYGKFAQDPRKYENWLFCPDKVPEPAYCDSCYQAYREHKRIDCSSCKEGETNAFGWYLHSTRGEQFIYASPQKIRPNSFFNVATAASITSAARADLLRGIQAASRPLYCDTDSIICEGLEANDSNGITLDPKALGAWDLEKEGDTVCIAGKKLYAIFKDGVEVKKASKGVKLSAEEIRRVCNGETIEYAHPVPKFTLDGEAKFTVRNIVMTG